MRILSWDEAKKAEADARYAATIGVFDGLHLGHKALVRKVVAQAPGLTAMAITFRTNPKRTTAPSRFTGDIFSLEQKLTALEEAGIEACVLIDFSGNFSKLAGNEFVSTLVKSCGVHSFVVGSDFRCGHRLTTDARALGRIASSLGATVEIVEPVLLDGAVVSSSRIRSAIAEGRTDLAFAMLGRPYTLDLRGIEFEMNRIVMSATMRHRGLVEPAAGIYEATVIVGSDALLQRAVFTDDGRLEVPLNSQARVDYVTLGAKLA